MIRKLLFIFCISAMAVPAQAVEALSASEQAAAFKAAGFVLNNKQWQGCGDPGTASYTPGSIEAIGDLNGDGHPEAVINEGSVYCFGDAGTGFSLVSKQADGSWKLITSGNGMPNFLSSKGSQGWPDIEIGGPGFCFPVERWNGKAYVLHGHQYQGKSCRPNQ